MNILMIHYKGGGTDGVSLEMDKWKIVLEKMGHRVYYLGGEMNNKVIYPPLYHISKVAIDLYSYSFEGENTFSSESEYKKTIDDEVKKIKPIIYSHIKDNNIDLVIVQNIWSVAMNIAVAIALEEVIQQTKVKVLAQHHDFFWERKKGVHYSSYECERIANTYLPPINEKYKHVVINQQGHDTLLTRKHLESSIVPNVFDFNGPLWEIDDFNNSFKEDLSFTENEIIILQATRIVDRKAIELAIDVVSKMNSLKSKYKGKTLYNGRVFDENSSFVLILAGYDDDDGTKTYLSRLKNHAASLNVDLRCINDKISHTRSTNKEIKKYSLWDTYVYADLITYPSYWEGWGNQFLEGLFAKVPMIVYEYPVFITDIKNKGFSFISLGCTHTVDEENNLVKIEDKILSNAAKDAMNYLFDKQNRKKCVEKNFEIGKKYFSLDSLYNQLKEIIDSLS